ncbi:MAG: RNA-binding S4 domain-containing protein [Saprospiraceae bacterium]|nr:RNA-binding S4 domain-containing protein [Saprospiraceae bacterium]
MEPTQFTLNDKSEFIELIKLLKIQGLAQTGGHAKILIEEGLVHVNGELEFRKRRKLRPGDTVEIEGNVVQIAE